MDDAEELATQPYRAPHAVIANGASFDPMQVVVTPELAPTVYGVIRRLALQTDLAGADRLLRELIGELTGSLSIVLVYPGADGPFMLDANDQLPADRPTLQSVAQRRRALVSSHRALIPIATATETIAVLAIERTATQPAFSSLDGLLMAAVARESASILHHLVAQHALHLRETEADKASLYRAEALESQRNRGHEGVLAELSPRWVRRTYPVLAIAMIAALVSTVIVHVPTYSSGNGIVVFGGTPVTAPMAGTVETVYVRSAQQVHRGDVLVKLASAKEDADLAQAQAELAAAYDQYLFDSADETIRKTLITARAQVKRAQSALAERSVRATRDGTVSDVRIRAGTGIQFGEPILTIVEAGTDPEVWAFLPGSDRPRLRPGMTLQVELVGFTKARESAQIYEVGGDVIGAAEARRTLGAEIADAIGIKQEGSYVLIRARLRSHMFSADQRTYRFHHGMPAKTEVRVVSKPFLASLLPSLERYF